MSVASRSDSSFDLPLDSKQPLLPPAATHPVSSTAVAPQPVIVEPEVDPESIPDGDVAGEHSEASWFQFDLGIDWTATLGSLAIHFVGLTALAFVLMLVPDGPPRAVSEAPNFESSTIPEPETREIIAVELDPHMTLVPEQQRASFSSSLASNQAGVVGDGLGGTGMAGGGGGTGPGGGGTGEGGIHQGASDLLAGIGTGPIEGLFIDVPTSRKLIVEAPDGQVGDARAVVGNYQEALDRITQEVLWMLDKGPVLVVWAFDQSESMKDDQKEIRERIEHVYKQLGLVSKHNRDALQTAVVSYGEGYLQHTRAPTSDWYEIKSCIDQVPTDVSGKEMMCSAVTQAIATHHGYAQRTNRQMCLILCTDESGEQPDNQSHLERAVAEAKSAGCKVFALGREATFGYPFAHLRWIHPQTGRHHWIRIDRGPETAFVEQLQTDGFHRRYDAHLSGFGPYEQTRLSHETGGVFFVLPSVETDLVRTDNRDYQIDAMRQYMPDIRSRLRVGEETEYSELRRALTKVIYDLNPYNPEAAKIIEMRVEFSPEPAALLRQIQLECAKATIYGEYLARTEKEMQRLEKLRRHEDSPRWQANYDLIDAQVIAYQARMFEYRAYLLEFAKNPKTVPPTKSPNLRHTGWDIHTRKQTITGKVVEPYIARATAKFKEVISNHPGTPWASRAEHELKRGFGVHLLEEYEAPDRVLPTGTTPMPIPKM